ncbi:phosphatidate cytidylyltransferase [Paenibacillus beijingensis]|uniref:Phosphatidate cytidylyltransferase n=1 Tax=Paenibacillus beijingensis TaxID=1126833 RepID=A0A0D5NN51_9BACL|nr:phosphatidate cytidylyltransferase [Paenibacillus beijingensis]AJY76600.1 phosphatidate cytidylyltransferase [Paenibacillus beijingensis]
MKQRIITGLLAGAVFVVLTVIGGWAYYVLLLLLALIGFREYARMNGFAPQHPASLLGYAGMLFFLFPWDLLQVERPSGSDMLWLLMLLLLALSVLTKNRTTIDGAALMLLGSLYLGYGFNAMMLVRDSDPQGLFWTTLSFGSIWASDIGAYFIGRAFGRIKLWPAISPNKTVEGSIGGVAVSLVVALLFSVFSPGWVSVGQALLIGLTAAVAGQFGDLIQSAYKRVRGIKDTGTLLPGHGGVLDRCDSWLIVFPLLVLTGLVPV